MPAALLKEGEKAHVDVPPADRIGVQSTPANEEASVGWADAGSPTSTRHRQKLALDVRDRCPLSKSNDRARSAACQRSTVECDTRQRRSVRRPLAQRNLNDCCGRRPGRHRGVIRPVFGDSRGSKTSKVVHRHIRLIICSERCRQLQSTVLRPRLSLDCRAPMTKGVCPERRDALQERTADGQEES
jgi:hypothetical protein